jgi:rod shape-determining protein MreD
MALKVFSIPALPRVNSGAARLLPVSTTLLAALVSILPLRIPGYAALTPAFTLMAAYHWTIYRPDLLPPLSLFAIGLVEDLAVGAPVVDRTFPFVWAGFTLLAVTAMLGLWALHCLLDATLLDLRTTLFRIVLTIAIFPLASFLLGRAQRALIGSGS